MAKPFFVASRGTAKRNIFIIIIFFESFSWSRGECNELCATFFVLTEQSFFHLVAPPNITKLTDTNFFDNFSQSRGER
jgi:hypothetical protein